MRARAETLPPTANCRRPPARPRANSAVFDGVGIHAGQPARLTVHPADAGSGLVFHRTGLPGARECFIPVCIANALPGTLATRLALPDAPQDRVGTVEHVLAALKILGIEDALLEIDGPEMPILDGSALPFVTGLAEAGFQTARLPRRTMKILEPVRVSDGASFAQFLPGDDGLVLDIAIDFANPAVGHQRRVLSFDANTFAREIAPARTFGFLADAERLWRDGFARAASFENTIVVGADAVLNPAGLRFADEFVRHKMLDALGDLALAGAAISGVFRSFRGGHALNRAAVAALLARPDAWRLVETRRPRVTALTAVPPHA